VAEQLKAAREKAEAEAAEKEKEEASQFNSEDY
jgi:hypothetical protein